MRADNRHGLNACHGPADHPATSAREPFPRPPHRARRRNDQILKAEGRQFGRPSHL